MMGGKIRAALLASTLLVGLGGCMHFERFAEMLHLRHAHRALAAAPSLYNAEDHLYADAVQAIDKRNYGEALGLLQVARESKPNDVRVITAMGVVYDKLGRFDLSGRYYGQAEKLDPGSTIIAQDERYSEFLQHAGAALAAGQAFAGVSPAGVVLAAAHEQPTLLEGDKRYAQGVEAIRRHAYGQAIIYLRDAHEALPGDARVLTALGVTYDHLGRFDLSARYYDEAGQLAPGSTVLAQDRRNSLMLQRHGGFDTPEDVVALDPIQPRPAVRTAEAQRTGRPE